MARRAIVAIPVRDQLELFLARADELASTRLLRAGFNASFNINWDHAQGTIFQTHEPDEDDLRAFLLTFRQFISNDEPVYLFKIYSLCYQHITNEELKANLVESRRSWQQELRQGGIRLNLKGRDISPEEVTNLWVNGYYFHNDHEKMLMLKSLLPHEHMLVRHIFLDHMIEATRRVMYVGRIVNIALREGLLRT